MRNTRRRHGRFLVLVTLVALLLWGLSRAGHSLVVFRPVEAPQAIVALASHEWERLPATAALARELPASTVLLTEPSVITESNCHRCSERVPWLAELGVAAERIQTLRGQGRGTHDEAALVRQYVERHGIRRLAIVTSPYHARRALATFRAAFEDLPVELGMYPACGTSPARPSRWWSRSYDRAYVAYEWAAALQYKLKYGVPLTAGHQDRQSLEDDCSMLQLQDFPDP